MKNVFKILFALMLAATCHAQTNATVTGNLLDIFGVSTSPLVTFTPSGPSTVGFSTVLATPKTVRPVAGAFTLTNVEAGTYRVSAAGANNFIYAYIPPGTNTYNLSQIITNAIIWRDRQYLSDIVLLGTNVTFITNNAHQWNETITVSAVGVAGAAATNATLLDGIAGAATLVVSNVASTTNGIISITTNGSLIVISNAVAAAGGGGVTNFFNAKQFFTNAQGVVSITNNAVVTNLIVASNLNGGTITATNSLVVSVAGSPIFSSAVSGGVATTTFSTAATSGPTLAFVNGSGSDTLTADDSHNFTFTGNFSSPRVTVGGFYCSQADATTDPDYGVNTLITLPESLAGSSANVPFTGSYPGLRITYKNIASDVVSLNANSGLGDAIDGAGSFPLAIRASVTIQSDSAASTWRVIDYYDGTLPGL